MIEIKRYTQCLMCFIFIYISSGIYVIDYLVHNKNTHHFYKSIKYPLINKKYPALRKNIDNHNHSHKCIICKFIGKIQVIFSKTNHHKLYNKLLIQIRFAEIFPFFADFYVLQARAPPFSL